jgi:hypothetical protein
VTPRREHSAVGLSPRHSASRDPSRVAPALVMPNFQVSRLVGFTGPIGAAGSHVNRIALVLLIGPGSPYWSGPARPAVQSSLAPQAALAPSRRTASRDEPLKRYIATSGSPGTLIRKVRGARGRGSPGR